MGKHIPTGNLVEEYMLGKTKIKIYDSAYIDKTPEDIEKILERITDIARRSLTVEDSSTDIQKKF